MSCRLDTLADMHCRRVVDMTKDMSPTCRRHAMSANEGLGLGIGKTRQNKTFPAKHSTEGVGIGLGMLPYDILPQ